MKARFLPATFLLFLALARPLEGASANLLANGGFDAGLAGWGRTENVTWSPAFGGSARISQASHAGWEALLQCVPVEANAMYRVLASANLPAARPGRRRPRRPRPVVRDGRLQRRDPARRALGLDFETSPEALQSKSRVLVAPEGARSAAVQLVARADTATTYRFSSWTRCPSHPRAESESSSRSRRRHRREARMTSASRRISVCEEHVGTRPPFRDAG